MATDIEDTPKLDVEDELATRGRLDELDEVEKELDDKINDIEELEVRKITNEYIRNKGSKQFDLINNDDKDFNYELKKLWYKFEFEESMYCSDIVLRSENKNIAGLELIAVTPFNVEYKTIVKNKESGNIKISIDKVISWFRINPNSRINKIKLTSIIVSGFLKSDFDLIQKNVKICNEIENFLESNKKLLKNEIDNFKEEYTKLKNDIDTLKKDKNIIDGTIKILKNQQTSIENIITENTKNNVVISDELDKARNNLSNLNDSTSKLISEIEVLRLDESKLRGDIKKLEANKNLFAYDIEDYVRQGNKNIGLYTFISLLPLIIIGYVSYYLFNGAVNIINIEKIALLKIPVYDVVISRIPFTLVAGAIVIACYEFSKIFIKKILEVNAQKLKFSEIGIVAKEVSAASVDGLELSETDKSDLRTKLKMDMLKHHLKGLSLDSFDYEPKNPSLLRYYLDFFLNKNKGTPEVKGQEVVPSSKVPEVKTL